MRQCREAGLDERQVGHVAVPLGMGWCLCPGTGDWWSRLLQSKLTLCVLPLMNASTFLPTFHCEFVHFKTIPRSHAYASIVILGFSASRIVGQNKLFSLWIIQSQVFYNDNRKQIKTPGNPRIQKTIYSCSISIRLLDNPLTSLCFSLCYKETWISLSTLLHWRTQAPMYENNSRTFSFI